MPSISQKYKKSKKGGMKNKNNKNKSYKIHKNTGKSKSYKLSTMKYADSGMHKLYRSLDEPRALLKNKKSKGITKKLRFGKNMIRSYDLTSSEKKGKMDSPTDIKECDYTDREDDFPCKYQNTVFTSLDEYNEYKKMKDARNKITGFKSRSTHYNEILGNKNRL